LEKIIEKRGRFGPRLFFAVKETLPGQSGGKGKRAPEMGKIGKNKE
jgi:hypothetical protein